MTKTRVLAVGWTIWLLAIMVLPWKIGLALLIPGLLVAIVLLRRRRQRLVRQLRAKYNTELLASGSDQAKAIADSRRSSKATDDPHVRPDR